MASNTVKQDIFPLNAVTCFLEFFSCPIGPGVSGDPFSFEREEINCLMQSTNLEISADLWCAKYCARAYGKTG